MIHPCHRLAEKDNLGEIQCVRKQDGKLDN